MITIVSFGYGHPEPPPEAHVTWDVRHLFRDPHISPEMRQLTGLDDAVVSSVLRQPGADTYARLTAVTTEGLVQLHGDVVVAFGCIGGRHRSVVFARALYARMRWVHETELMHRDVDKPVLERGR